MPHWESISLIAHYTAQIWAREHLPWAHRFDTRRGRLLYSATEPLFTLASRAGLTTPVQFCVQRHRIIDALIARIAPAQVVELAGGLSPRGLALAQKRGIPCIDVDLPAVVAEKARLAGDDLPPSYQQIPMDIAGSADYAADLSPALQKLAPTVVISEGILAYFPLELQQQVFARVAALLRACGGGTYLCDVHHEEAVQRLGPAASLFRQTLHLVSRTQQEAFIHDEAAGRRMMEQAGFDRVTAHLPAQWQKPLGLPSRSIDSGLSIYEATVLPE